MTQPEILNTVFPEGVMSLQQADPELYDIIKDEKSRQRYDSCGLPVLWLQMAAWDWWFDSVISVRVDMGLSSLLRRISPVYL